MKESEMTDMNIQESRDFVVKYRPLCCGKQVDAMGYEITNSWQHFVCRGCDEKFEIKYWPLTFETMRDLKLNSILS
jgi:hypothetical protein